MNPFSTDFLQNQFRFCPNVVCSVTVTQLNIAERTLLSPASSMIFKYFNVFLKKNSLRLTVCVRFYCLCKQNGCRTKVSYPIHNLFTFLLRFCFVQVTWKTVKNSPSSSSTEMTQEEIRRRESKISSKLMKISVKTVKMRPRSSEYRHQTSLD